VPRTAPTAAAHPELAGPPRAHAAMQVRHTAEFATEHPHHVCAELLDVEFGTLRDALAIADSVTSKHLKALEDAG
jgi:hypothetical protein